MTKANNGQLIWITGLSAAGKTTVALALSKMLDSLGVHPVLLDGDQLRNIFGNVFGYDDSSRRNLAFCYSRLCKSLVDQGLFVICSTIAMYDEVRKENANTIERYIEVYLKVPYKVRSERDPKGLYKKAKEGELQNFSGENELFEEPKNPHIIVENYGQTTPDETALKILNFCANKK